MPADGRNAAARIYLGNPAADVVEAYRVQTVCGSEFDAADLPARNGGIVARAVVHVRKTVFAALVSVGEVVLMADHHPARGQIEKPPVQRAGLRRRRPVRRGGRFRAAGTTRQKGASRGDRKQSFHKNIIG